MDHLSTSTHPKLSKNVYVYCIIPSSLFTMICFKRAKTVCLQDPRASFCGILNELNTTCIAHAYLVASQWTWVQILLSEKCPGKISAEILLSVINQ